MDFAEALKAMKMGSCIKREAWKPDTYLEIKPFCHYHSPFIARYFRSGRFVPWIATNSDMLADDWFVYFKNESV